MITISTLNDATEQQVFDQVATHLLAQGKRATDGSSPKCRYRTNTGLMCAAGCLMTDDEYHESFENISFEALSFDSIPARRISHFAFIQELQETHDSIEPEDWRRALRDLAIERELEWRHVLGD